MFLIGFNNEFPHYIQLATPEPGRFFWTLPDTSAPPHQKLSIYIKIPPVPWNYLCLRLEELDQISRWVHHPGLRASRAAHDVFPSKWDSLLAQPVHFTLNIIYGEEDPVPASRDRSSPILHRSAPGAFFSAQEKPKVPACDGYKCRAGIRLDYETQMICVEGNGFIDIIDHIANAYKARRFSIHIVHLYPYPSSIDKFEV